MPTIPIPVFVDCDNTMGLPGSEIDDGLALLYLLGRAEVRIVGISATFGNGPVDVTTRQTRLLMSLLGVTLPVSPGADRALLDEPDARSRAARRGGSDAATALVRASREHAGGLVVLGLGSLTNLAGAAERDPGFFHRLAGVVVMGGYLAPLRFARREVDELNLSSDPEASHAVLNAPCPVTVMCAQLCLAARFGPWDLLVHNRGPRWLRRLVREWFFAFSLQVGASGFYLWDLVPAAFVVDRMRFPAAPAALRSTVSDLQSGRLVLEQTGTRDVDLREPGVVSVPRRIVRPGRFAAECASVWARTASERTARSPHRGTRGYPFLRG